MRIFNNLYNLKTNNDKSSKFIYLFVYGLVIRIIFSTLGHNTDWPFIKEHALMTSERLDVYQAKDFYPYFPTRFLIEIPIFKLSEYLNLSTYNFLDMERVFFIFVYFSIQSLVLLYFKNYINPKQYTYFHTSLLLGFISGFTNQLDVFVIVLAVVCLNVFDKSRNTKTHFLVGFFFLLFGSIKPLMLPIIFFLLFLDFEKKLIHFYLGNLVGIIVIFLTFFTNIKYFPDYDILYSLNKILGYVGFNNMPLINLLNINFDLKIDYLKLGSLINPKNLLIISFFGFLSYKIRKNRKLKIDYLIYQYLILFFIFAPTIAQQNLPILFISINLFMIPKTKNNLIFFELVSIFYLILLNMLSLFDGAISNPDYLLNDIYEFLNYYGLAFIPNERYFGNFVFFAILYYFLFEKDIVEMSQGSNQ